MNKFVITIGRQLGSGGKEIGAELSRRLGIPCYDRELIQMASQESGLGSDFFDRADEKKFRFINIEEGYAHNYLGGEYLFKIQSDVIRHIANEQSSIFVGRCADYILREHPHLISVFISARLQERIQRICDHHRLPAAKAKELIERADKKRAAYYNYYTNKMWGVAASYHLCINSSVLGIAGTAGYIQRFVEEAVQDFSTLNHQIINNNRIHNL